MRLLDLFCGAGGAAMGYHRAGFEVVGVDIKLQPHYPFEFHEADALEYVAEHGREFDVIHASPPCQRYSRISKTHGVADRHPDLLPETRRLLVLARKPYIIENVEGAPLQDAITLCGTMFGLRVRRHRLFETSFSVWPPFLCCHDSYAVGVYGHSGAGANRGRERARGNDNTHDVWESAMGISWMTNAELAQAIPPAYTEYIGRQLMEASQRGA
jgi:DNA (cytosine-5)-methyltransferase 1